VIGNHLYSTASVNWLLVILVWTCKILLCSIRTKGAHRNQLALNYFLQLSYRQSAGQVELLKPLLSMGSLAGPYSGGSDQTSGFSLAEIDRLISDLQARFPNADDGMDEIFGPLIQLLLSHPSLAHPEGLSSGDTGWRAILVGLEALLKHRPICKLITRLPEWCPENADAAHIETESLLGPLSRLSMFAREWVG
jgi:ubiquitin conjugation factor E4 B